jgi:hypothetical protein
MPMGPSLDSIVHKAYINHQRTHKFILFYIATCLYVNAELLVKSSILSV